LAGRDFTVGYSPERINAGDKAHRFETIIKIVSGRDARTLEVVAAVYGSVVKVGLHKAVDPSGRSKTRWQLSAIII
jgi:UDP-N-acetyl-D-glucosamine/UDP-N-acetyl-D-galactosamine dehydrogenase